MIDHLLIVYLKTLKLSEAVQARRSRRLANIDCFAVGQAVSVEAFVAERTSSASLKTKHKRGDPDVHER